MSNFLVCGTSVSAGFGLNDNDKNNNFWIRYLINSEFPTCNIDNLSEVGTDNRTVVKNAYTAIRSGKYRHALVCWSMIPRTNINYGLELYSTTGTYVTFSDKHFNDLNLHSGQTVSVRAQKNHSFDMRYYNYHWDIADLVLYANMIKDVADQNNCQVCFVNFCLPWKSNRYFEKVNWGSPSELDEFTQEVLEVKYRSDDQIQQLYNKIHSDYDQMGGIGYNNWLNLYEPMQNIQIDQASNTIKHPGPKSQRPMADFLIPKFRNFLNHNS